MIRRYLRNIKGAHFRGRKIFPISEKKDIRAYSLQGLLKQPQVYTNKGSGRK